MPVVSCRKTPVAEVEVHVHPGPKLYSICVCRVSHVAKVELSSTSVTDYDSLRQLTTGIFLSQLSQIACRYCESQRALVHSRLVRCCRRGPHTHTHTHTHINTHTHTHKHTHTHIHAHIHACTHAHTQAHTHTHTHIPVLRCLAMMWH